MADKKPTGYAADNQIDAWKAKHGLKYVHEILTIDEDDVEHVSYVRKPNLDNLQMLADYAKKDQEIKGLKVLFNTIRLGGSDEVANDPEMYLAAISAAGKLFKKKEAKVKKR